VNPTKVNAIRKMKKPTRKKDMMKLTVMMASLGRKDYPSSSSKN
jgi:hypothetical protein